MHKTKLLVYMLCMENCGNEKCIVKMLDEYLSLLPYNGPYFDMRENEEFCESEEDSALVLNRELVSTH